MALYGLATEGDWVGPCLEIIIPASNWLESPPINKPLKAHLEGEYPDP